ncbi:protein of unknown function [Candidatus Promineifilum breve]|uniref:Uncharacterized protein n=2 Tax=Candidatus Promineifilum breve TaxID=1806508 RepID=A0A160T4B3_9CHLR|nr:protein of unknown function [Candidatus Promineifilum breve]
MDIESGLEKYAAVQGFKCPAEFWPALGYEGEARYVAIWWERGGDEAAWSDGRLSVVGAGWAAYLELIRANFEVGWAAGWLVREGRLGSSDDEATHRLVIDREKECAWFVPFEEAREVLQTQWSMRELAPLPGDSMAEWLAMVRWELAQGGTTSLNDIGQRIKEEQRRYEVFVAALERRKGESR